MRLAYVCPALLSLAVLACGSANDADSCDCAEGEICVDDQCVVDGDPPPGANVAQCEVLESPPDNLLDTCFGRIQTGRLAPNLRLFRPSYEQYVEGATKRRWIYIPPDTQVDVSQPDDWTFPVGTVFWQELTLEERVETRMLEKTGSGTGFDEWRSSSYLWLSDQSDAHLTSDGAAPSTSGYVISSLEDYPAPSPSTCGDCHESSGDGILGFAHIQLSDTSHLGNVEVWTDEGYLSADRQPIDIVGDESDQEVLGYLHANCGTCHSPGGSVAGLGLDLRYLTSATDLDSTRLFQTAVYQELLLTPGNTTASAIYEMFDDGSMPPPEVAIAVDDDFGAQLRQWLLDIEWPTNILVETLPITVGADAGNGVEWMGYPVTDTDPTENVVFVREDYLSFRSRVVFPIDTTKTYRVSGKFKSEGVVQSKLYFGLAPYDESGELIAPHRINRIGSDGNIDASATTSSSIALQTAITGWYQPPNVGYRRQIGFYYDGDTSHLPDYIVRIDENRTSNDPSAGAYSSATGTEIVLNVELPQTVLSQLSDDTVVRNHYDGGSTYIYTAASNATVDTNWQPFSGDITGEAFTLVGTTFRTGTRFAKLLVLANYGQAGLDTRLVFDELRIEEVAGGGGGGGSSAQ